MSGSRQKSALDHRIRVRDPAAIRAVVEGYADQIFRAARGLGLSPAEAEDLCQAVFMTFVETADRFEGRSHVRTWLFGILYRKLAEHRRSEARARAMGELDDIVEQRFDTSGSWQRPPEPADATAIGREIRQQIGGCLEASPLQPRMAFLLYEVEGLTYAEIREILGVSTNHLGVMLYRIRNRLRECLEAKGLVP